MFHMKSVNGFWLRAPFFSIILRRWSGKNAAVTLLPIVKPAKVSFITQLFYRKPFSLSRSHRRPNFVSCAPHPATIAWGLLLARSNCSENKSLIRLYNVERCLETITSLGVKTTTKRLQREEEEASCDHNGITSASGNRFSHPDWCVDGRSLLEHCKRFKCSGNLLTKLCNLCRYSLSPSLWAAKFITADEYLINVFYFRIDGKLELDTSRTSIVNIQFGREAWEKYELLMKFEGKMFIKQHRVNWRLAFEYGLE